MGGTEKRLKTGPFEAYYNEFTESYHLVRYTGKLASGRAYGCTRIGTFATMAEARDRMLEVIMGVINELG